MSAERDQIKRQAGSALRKAGRAHLTDLDLRPVSSSPRQWVGDRGWWLINVEFQASSWSVGSYLNVGVQYLWSVKDHRTFGHGNPRFPIPGSGQFAELEGDEDQVRAKADSVGSGARDAVLGLIARWPDDNVHLRLLSSDATSGLWQSVDAAVAAALLQQNDQARELFRDLPARLDLSIAWQAELATDCAHLGGLAADPAAFKLEIQNRIEETRRRLKLPSRDAPFVDL
ncbi:hypothetical protein SAMN05892883_3111 [Jatrophihabitans sp. GAS493]|uniref:hypothetical protein n=1 Tax=Jatrophihabitans sp. GAS493 TaxID=1907575 RepID=UPI000BB67A68|nr:hypothetical protein [Jatrophihabitans sp. GAS493]SOD73920.1 hypothetical protein SAMN05892883_3111 [Jatrophihabitans sp. GAS493]